MPEPAGERARRVLVEGARTRDSRGHASRRARGFPRDATCVPTCASATMAHAAAGDGR